MKSVYVQYQDIISHRHHVSESRPPMPMHSRAAQFAPFAALTGYDDMISESARYTEETPDLSESLTAELNDRLVFLLSRTEPPVVTLTWFLPDARKSGGRYMTFTDRLVRYDPYKRRLLFASGLAVPVGRITGVESDVLDALGF